MILIVVISSCGNNIKTEEDKYPSIPEFPKFKDDVFVVQNIGKLELKPLAKYKRTSENPYFLQYVVKNSSLYVVAFYTDREFPFIPLDDDYDITMLKITNGKIVVKRQWVDNDFEFNFWIKPNNDLIVGKQNFTAKDDYNSAVKMDSLKIDSINDTRFSSWYKANVLTEASIIKNNQQQSFIAFDSVIIDTKSEMGGGFNNGFRIDNHPVYLSYYNLKWNNKAGQTKIDFSINENPPILIKTDNNFYYIQYTEFFDKSNDTKYTKAFTINQIN